MHDLIVSAAEAYDQESLGLLFGTASSGRVTVQRAFPFQIVAERSSTDVRIDPDARKRMREVVFDLNGPGDFMGYFHSHPGIDSISSFGHLSESDLAAMRSNEIEVLVSIQPAVEPRKKLIRRKGEQIECVVGSRYFTVSAYEAVEIDSHPFKIAEHIDILTGKEFIE